MKGAIIAVILGVIVFWSLNTRTLSIFFKIKRQRLYKQNNFYETNNNEINISERFNESSEGGHAGFNSKAETQGNVKTNKEKPPSRRGNSKNRPPFN